jgi:hypothetical protein
MAVNNSMFHFLPCSLMHETPADLQLLDQESQLKMPIQLLSISITTQQTGSRHWFYIWGLAHQACWEAQKLL